MPGQRISLAAILVLGGAAACDNSPVATGPTAVEPAEPAGPALAIEPGAAVLNIGESLQFRAFGTMVQTIPALFAMTWTSSDPTIAEVNTLGMLSAKALGAIQITVTVAGQSATANIVVAPAGPDDGPRPNRPPKL
jgi:hypothetical protein